MDDSDDGSSSSDENDSAAAAHAAAIGHSPQPQPLPPKVVIPNAVGEEGIMVAAENGEKDTNDTVDEMIKNQANEGLAPMAISPKEGGNEVIDAAQQNGEAQEGASVNKSIKRIKYYCPHNLNERDTDENTPLHIAIHARKLEHVKLLLEAGASVHKKSDGSAPIHLAISLGSVGKHSDFAHQCVVTLAEKGADLAVKDDSMHTPLYLACMFCLPEIVKYILSHEIGKTTLNARADRSQGRPLHAAAKYDVSVPRAAGINLASASSGSAPLQVTKILLDAPDIEVDAANSFGQSPLHIACSRGNWSVVRLLLEAGASATLADRRGFTPGQLAHKRGMPIPKDLLEILGGPPSSGVVAPPRDLIIDPDGKTIVLTHELCGLHNTCAPIRRDPHSEPPPENVRRLHVLTDGDTGILRSGEFSKCTWENETRRAAMVDVLKVRAIDRPPKMSMAMF